LYRPPDVLSLTNWKWPTWDFLVLGLGLGFRFRV
jgi:hypothetical protein